MPTGSHFLIEAGGKKFAIDCGLVQGEAYMIPANKEPFAYDVSTLDALIVTHGHLDHVGKIPVLVASGFRGDIYSTPPTREIAELIMLDSLGVLEKEAEATNEKNLYEAKDVFQAMGQWKHVYGYETQFTIPTNEGNMDIIFHDAGHILGSATVEFRFGGKRFMFTGDLGNTPSKLLKDTTPPVGIEHLFIESVYGDRNHEDKDVREKLFLDTVRNAIRKNGTIVVPAFSIERTQEVLQLLNEAVAKGEFESLPVYLDSPLGINITKVYRKYSDYLSPLAQEESKLDKDKDIFNFPNLIQTPTREESKRINEDTRSKIIIAGSGMSNGGRVLHHEARYLSDPNSTVLIIGYQAVHTLGRKLVEGQKKVTIMGREVDVKCKIVNIHGFSAHKDSDNLLAFAMQAKDTLKNVHVILGEPKSAMYLAQKIHINMGVKTDVPEHMQVIEIE